ncbi:hypothetical protein P4E94_02780 [Pontiellaceae bacterium B12219]|nr:hypothetical protein [Pontiellaceae bacterium B12219]
MGIGSASGIISSLSLLMSATVQAATIHWTGGAASNDWNAAANWSTAEVPGATTDDSAIFAGSADSTTLAMPFSFANASSITVRDDAVVTLNANLSGINQFYLAPNANVAGGTVVQQSGTVSAQTVKVGNSNTALSESWYTAAGGTLSVSGELYVNKGTFSLVGSSATVTADALKLTNTGGLDFKLGASGVIPIQVANQLTIGAESTLTIDGSAYAGNGGTNVLVQFGSFSGIFDPANIVIDGMDGASISYEDDSMNLVIPDHVATNVVFSSSTNWSSAVIHPSDDVVVDSGATVTVGTDGAANSLLLNGTLKFELDTVGDSSLTLNTLTFGAGWAIEVDGSGYEGMDLYFPIILATGLPTSLTNTVTFYGFGEREPALVAQDDGLWLRLIAPPSLSVRLCSLVPESTVATDYSNSVFAATRALKPTGSAWQPSFNEAHVMDTTLSQAMLGSENHSWDLTVGRAGQIASFRVPTIGEIIPPQWQHKSWPGGSDRSPWIDEVWQGVAVRTPAANSWYIHQGGTYLFDPIQTEPFYSPQLAAELDAENHSFTTINWGQQAHTSIFTDDDPTNDYQSYVLYFTRVRDLGQGLIEVSLGFYNYGHDHVDHFNMPWGGIRLTNLREYFLSKPDGTWALATDGWDGDEDRYKDYDEAGGWVAFCNSTNAATPALGLVYGNDPEPLLSKQTRKSYMWWKQTVTDYEADETASRNYGVFATIRKYTLNQGHGIWGRYYFVLGDDVADVETRIEERQLLADESIVLFNYTESNSPLVGYRFSGSGSGFRIEENGLSPDFFLYAHPVTGSFPIYEIIEDDKSRYLTWNPYATGVIKTYDGTIAGMRLLGFALPSGEVAGSPYAYESLDTIMAAAPGNYLPSGETLSVRTATAQEAWRIDHFGFADNTGDFADTANPDADALNNLGEYAFGGDPTNALDIGYLPKVGSGTNGFEYVYARRTTPGHGLTYTVENSSNLLSNDWKTAAVVELPNPGTLDADFEAVTNRVDTAVKSNAFFRVKVDRENK